MGDCEQVAGCACFYSRPVERELEKVSGGAGQSPMGGRDTSRKSLMQATLHGRALRRCLGTRDDYLGTATTETAGLGEPRLRRARAIAAWEVEKAGRRADAGVNVVGARPVPSRPVVGGVRKCIHVLATDVPHHALVKRATL